MSKIKTGEKKSLSFYAQKKKKKCNVFLNSVENIK